MKPENGIFKIYVKHRIENKILYQMHFLVFDLKIPWRNILRIIKKIPPEFRLLVIAEIEEKNSKKAFFWLFVPVQIPQIKSKKLRQYQVI